MNTFSVSESYKKAGVDITAGYRAVELMKAHISRTKRPALSRTLGIWRSFCARFTGISEPVLVSGTDGVERS